MPFYSPSTRGFYRADLHGRDIPADAVKITTRKHQELLHAQQQGHLIVDTPAGLAVHYHGVDPDAARATAARRVKREARRRILAIASLEQQSNDNAAMAFVALSGGDSTTVVEAIERRQKIDAVRAASNLIEASLAGHTVAELTAFDAAAAAWPNN